MNTEVLLANGCLPAATAVGSDEPATTAELGTVLANLAYFGFTPSADALQQLRALSSRSLVDYWSTLHPVLRALTGDDRDMGRFVVYKNFPREVLAMSEARYWVNQILMYLGMPAEWAAEEGKARAPLTEKLKLKVLLPADTGTLAAVYQGLVVSKARWTEVQRKHAVHLVRELKPQHLDVTAFGFKENGITLVAATLDEEGEVTINDATDVLRLAAAMSDSDVSLREEVKLRQFHRSERRFLLSLLDDTKNLQADMALRPALWKKLLTKLRPGDYKFRNVIQAYHALYEGDLRTFNAQLEALLHGRDPSALELLKSRPGEFARRLHALYGVFGQAAVDAFVAVAPRLSTAQLLKLRGYVRSASTRQMLIYAPRGNWSKAKFVANEKAPFDDAALTALLGAFDAQLRERLAEQLPQGVALSADVENVKLQTNDQELAPYGRGTVFPMPASVRFVRTASYWASKEHGTTWFDNSVNFFNEDWTNAGTCCWNSTHGLGQSLGQGAVFSGDPINSRDIEGRACQMIDLDLKALADQGVRYAVWSILCYSRVPFESADVLATLQWGFNPDKGKLYEPARAQLVFPLKGKSLAKYVAYLDLKSRCLVYMDANLPGEVSSAQSNAAVLQERMPAFLEYLASLPSVMDLLIHAPQGSVPVVYDDEQVELKDGETAYVFKPTRAGNSFKPLALAELL